MLTGDCVFTRYVLSARLRWLIGVHISEPDQPLTNVGSLYFLSGL